jgi:hypothetical protein
MNKQINESFGYWFEIFGRSLAGHRKHYRQAHHELTALPWPSLWASTDPPCISTSIFTSDRPMPNPLCARSNLRA